MKLRNKLKLTTAIAFGIALTLISWTIRAQNDTTTATTTGQSLVSSEAGKFIGAGLAIGLAGMGASIGMGNASSAAIGAISENEDMFGSTLIFVVLIEAVAIYGLLIAILLIFAV